MRRDPHRRLLPCRLPAVRAGSAGGDSQSKRCGGRSSAKSRTPCTASPLAEGCEPRRHRRRPHFGPWVEYRRQHRQAASTASRVPRLARRRLRLPTGLWSRPRRRPCRRRRNAQVGHVSRARCRRRRHVLPRLGVAAWRRGSSRRRRGVPRAVGGQRPGRREPAPPGVAAWLACARLARRASWQRRRRPRPGAAQCRPRATAQRSCASGRRDGGCASPRRRGKRRRPREARQRQQKRSPRAPSA